MKKIIYFFVYLLLGIFIFNIIEDLSFFLLPNLVNYFFYSLYAVILILYIGDYLKRKSIIYLLFVIYLIIAITPFPSCNKEGWGILTQSCKCFGLVKTMNALDDDYSVCLGYRTEINRNEREIPAPSLITSEEKYTLQNENSYVENIGSDLNKYVNHKYGFEFVFPAIKGTDFPIKNAENFNFYIYDTSGYVYAMKSIQFSNIFGEQYEEELKKLNDNFDSYKEDLSMENRNPDFEGLWFNIRKMKIDGVPALDYWRCGGGDTCGRNIYVMKDGNIINIFHNKIYYGISEIEMTDQDYSSFQKILDSFKFIKN